MTNTTTLATAAGISVTEPEEVRDVRRVTLGDMGRQFTVRFEAPKETINADKVVTGNMGRQFRA
ncbi:MAG: hypothetical protein J0H67_21770 [Rhodospirillales bacterium]|nr:hypothetical protein [Rhodospirillales bacterium]